MNRVGDFWPERDTQSAMGKTDDYVEGVLAFREKRTARFNGR